MTGKKEREALELILSQNLIKQHHRQANGIPQMVPALKFQERTSSEHCIRYIQTETENHLEKSDLLDLG